MNIIIDFQTDSGMLMLYDPLLVKNEKEFNFNWHDYQPVKVGRVSIIGLQSDGVYRLRLTDGELTISEKEIINDELVELGVEILSGQLYITGRGLPGQPYDGFEVHDVEPGLYNLTLYELDRTNPQHRDMPDFVAIIKPRTSPFKVSQEQPSFTGGLAMDKFLAENGFTN